MPDRNSSRDAAEGALAFQALLYASGELEGEPATAFEARLAEDQSAREALAQAVQLSLALAGHAAPDPDPAYREAVRRRLRPRGAWQRIWSKRFYRGHPALWGLLGAAAASVAFIMFAPAPAPPSAAFVEQAPAAPTTEMANVWAELHNSDHLTRAHGEEARRKLRAEDRRSRLPGMHIIRQ